MMLSQCFHLSQDRVAAKRLWTVPSSILEFSLSRSLDPEMWPTEHDEGEKSDSRMFLLTSGTSAWQKPSLPSLANAKHRKECCKPNVILWLLIVHRKLPSHGEMCYAFQYCYIDISALYIPMHVQHVCIYVYKSKVEQTVEKQVVFFPFFTPKFHFEQSQNSK